MYKFNLEITLCLLYLLGMARSGKLKQDRQYNDKRKRTKHNKWATKKYAEN
jgi:hypothetical protein